MSEKYSKDSDQKIVAVVLGWFSSCESMYYIKEITASCVEHGIRIVFFSTMTDLYYGNSNDRLEEDLLNLICVERFDAILILTESFKGENLFDALIARANQAEVPVISIDRKLPGCTAVVFDYIQAFREIVEHMVVHHGFREINFMNGRKHDPYSEERLVAYKEVLEEHGIAYDPRRVYYGEWWEGPTEREMERMLKDWPKLPEAIVCGNDSMAIEVNDFLIKRGYRVPEDVATSGFDGIDIVSYSNPRLTTGIHDIRALIEKAYEIVLNPSEAGGEKAYEIPYRMQIGCSCGCDGIKTRAVSSEMIKLQSEVYRETEFQNSMNEMVSVCGNEDSFLDFMKDAVRRLRPIGYGKLWFCANTREQGEEQPYQLESDIWSMLCYKAKHVYSDQMWVMKAENETGEIMIHKNAFVDTKDLIPDLNQVLAENGYMLFTTLHLTDQTIGYMGITFDRETFWASAYASFITSFRYIIELHRNTGELLRAYMIDPLTGLYNRVGFFDRVGKLLAYYADSELSLISMDMDGLKYINDTYGHAMGDEAIAALGHMIAQCAKGQLSTRIGGDEFLILVMGADSRRRADGIVAEMRQQIDTYNIEKKRCYTLHMSAGVYTDQIAEHSLDDFMKKADALMYENKKANKRSRSSCCSE